jgi:hypothetical protein
MIFSSLEFSGPPPTGSKKKRIDNSFARKLRAEYRTQACTKAKMFVG